jgi:hypothetical protein
MCTIVINFNSPTAAINKRYVSHYSTPSKYQDPFAVIFAQIAWSLLDPLQT